MIQTHANGKQAKKNIEAFFKDAQAKGPAMIYEEVKNTPLTTLGIDIRQDSFQQIYDLTKE